MSEDLGLVRLEDAWYNSIEAEVREFVRHLRNRGFNTVCSCGHEMVVQIQCNAEDLPLLWSVCAEFYGSENACEIQFFWHSWCRYAEVLIRLPGGGPNPKWSSMRDWAGNPYDAAAEQGGRA